MENAHLRMGTLKFVRQSKDHTTNVSLCLDRLVAEAPKEQQGSAILHFISVFGGDQEVGAIAAAVGDGQRFHVHVHGQEIVGDLGSKAILYRSSLQIPGRKRPVRHLVALSQAFFETTLGANGDARRTILFDSAPEFMLHRLAVRFGLPVLPDWAQWFHAELYRRGMVEELSGLNCYPVAVKGNKVRMLRVLRQGLRRGQIVFPREDRLFVPTQPELA